MIMACKQDILDVTFSSEAMCSAVKSFTMSKKLTQAVMNTSVLNILYQRLVLNQSDLKIREIEDISVMVLKRKNVKDPLLRHYLAWIKGIADAIDKNYLKEAFLFMKNPANDEIIETYKFSLKYNNDDNKESRRTPSHVKQATLEFLQVINNLNKNEKLNENTEVQIELTYFDMTPRHYEPPGFQASVDKYCLHASTCNIHLGMLNTGYHKLTCYGGGEAVSRMVLALNDQALLSVTSEGLAKEVETRQDPFEQSTVENMSENEDEAEDPTPKITNPNIMAPKLNSNNTSVSVANMNVEEAEDPALKITKPKIEVPKFNTSNITVSDVDILSENSIEMTEAHYACLCQLTMPLDADIIECLDCKRQYHAPCHGYLSKEDARRADFVCIQCSDKDAALYQISSDERLLFCRIRFVLYYLDKRGQLPFEILKFMSESHRNKLVTQLENFNVFVGKKNSKVNQVALRKVIEKFFILEDSQVF
ncbi:HORMA domain-containing protein 1-like [Anoplophora glabripennis]|uniref:HORMA domain-containing protein 1-like n=1 Tax=Anoplophora glabripennis TaxID=217634 RepID=UPI0008758F06|nr:HORMA domain-containing protein 1-like [Anoplophora glabripennis]